MDQQIKDLITNEINENEICLFMKGAPDDPDCGFSMAVAIILKVLDVNFIGVYVLAVKKEFDGGCDIIKEMYANGELAKHFDDKQISYKKS